MKRLLAGKDDAAALQQQIAALRAEGRDASLAIEELKQQRVRAESYDLAREVDDKIARQQWIVEHAAAALPELELRLAAVRAADQAEALARHKTSLLELYPRLKRALVAAVAAQEEAMAAREAACRELGEAVVSRNLPVIGFTGFLRSEFYEIWRSENDRVFADLARQPKPAAIAAPVRAALPVPKLMAPVAAAKEPAPRPARVARHDPFPSDGQNQLVIFLKVGVEVPGGEIAGIGDQVSLPVQQARALCERGVVDYVTPAAGEENASG